MFKNIFYTFLNYIISLFHTHSHMYSISHIIPDIIDLEQTLPLMLQALDVTAHVVYRGGMVLFLSRHLQTLPWVERMARDVGEYSHCRPWSKGDSFCS